MSRYYVFFQVLNLFNVNYVEPHLSGNVAMTAMLNSTTMNVQMNVKLVGEKNLKSIFVIQVNTKLHENMFIILVSLKQ